MNTYYICHIPILQTELLTLNRLLVRYRYIIPTHLLLAIKLLQKFFIIQNLFLEWVLDINVMHINLSLANIFHNVHHSRHILLLLSFHYIVKLVYQLNNTRMSFIAQRWLPWRKILIAKLINKHTLAIYTARSVIRIVLCHATFLNALPSILLTLPNLNTLPRLRLRCSFHLLQFLHDLLIAFKLYLLGMHNFYDSSQDKKYILNVNRLV